MNVKELKNALFSGDVQSIVNLFAEGWIDYLQHNFPEYEICEKRVNETEEYYVTDCWMFIRQELSNLVLDKIDDHIIRIDHFYNINKTLIIEDNDEYVIIYPFSYKDREEAKRALISLGHIKNKEIKK